MRNYTEPKMDVKIFSEEAILTASTNISDQMNEWATNNANWNAAVGIIDFNDLSDVNVTF